MSFCSIYYHNWTHFLVISVISFLNTKIYLAVRLVSYSTIYYHNWARFLVLLASYPSPSYPSSTPRSTWLIRLVSYSTIYYHNWARFLVFGILTVSVISFLNTKIYLAVRLVNYSTIY
jgi:hypothetical protein